MQSTSRRIVINTTSLTAASFWRIAVSFVLQLLVARQLDAAALGVFALMLAWLQIGQIAAEAGLPAWMVRECAGHPERRRGMLALVTRLQVLLSLCMAVLFVVAAWLLPALFPPLPLVAITMLSLPLYAVMSASLALFESAESLARVFVVDVATNTLLLATSAAMLFMGYGLGALFAALVVCQLFSALLALYLVWRSRLLTGVRQNTAPGWREALQASRAYFTVAFADVLQQRADLLLVGAVASPAATGLYAAAVSIVRVLLKVVQAFWRALYPTLGRLHGDGEDAAESASSGGYRALHTLALRLALAATVGVAVIVTPLAGEIARLLFGNDFAAAGTALMVLIWSAPLYTWETYAVTRLMAQRAAHAAMWISLAHLGALVVLLPLLTWRWEIAGAASASVLAALAGSAAGFWLLRVWNDARLAGVLLRFAACALLGALGGVLMRNGISWLGSAGAPDSVLSALAVASVALLIYLIALIALRLLSASDVQQFRRVLQRQSG